MSARPDGNPLETTPILPYVVCIKNIRTIFPFHRDFFSVDNANVTRRPQHRDEATPSVPFTSQTMTTDNSQITLKLRTGQEIILPPRKDLLGGLKFTRRFSHNEVHPYDEVDWARRDVRIMDWKTGKTIYERLGPVSYTHLTLPTKLEV